MHRKSNDRDTRNQLGFMPRDADKRSHFHALVVGYLYQQVLHNTYTIRRKVDYTPALSTMRKNSTLSRGSPVALTFKENRSVSYEAP